MALHYFIFVLEIQRLIQTYQDIDLFYILALRELSQPTYTHVIHSFLKL